MELKDFWIFSKHNYFPNLDFDIEKGSTSVLLGGKNNFCKINKLSGKASMNTLTTRIKPNLNRL